MASRRCLACGRTFQPRPQAPQQSYCSAPECQRERKKLWERERRHSDPDYRENQAAARQAWSHRHPEYWKAYRRANPSYTERNRQEQRKKRTGRPFPAPAAKMDASAPAPALEPGLYRITRVAGGGVAKMDAWLVRITVVSKA